MKRREFITLLGGAAVAWPIGAYAQQRRIAVLVPGRENDPEYQSRTAAFVSGLRQHGWIAGPNLTADYRWGGGDPNLMNDYAKELLQLAPAVVFTNGTAATAALQRHNKTSTAIVFAVVSDPVGDGFVQSFSHPGGNITGFSTFDPDIGGKWLELLQEAYPATQRVGVLFNPKTAAGGGSLFMRPNASRFAIETIPTPAQEPAAIEVAIKELAGTPNSALVVMPDSFMIAHRELIIGVANGLRLPAIYPFRVFGTAGGLMVYGVDVIDLNLRAASYVHRILNGEKPADLPVQAPTKFEFIINLKTAKSLGLDLPPRLLARADEVIE
jgi:putative ABC transport system substrate-binding protein